ncbi:hypothetical protein EDD16DRAFT_1704856 [Pisolithus croceorrhizus]|nr:hypothetical protein EDD16DRAFT_1704856 [Pisolithus croceorrhizus]KAI6168947.1 hypothetical protein EDD17DRAFT_1523889 [Pisolithus thermaeus]
MVSCYFLPGEKFGKNKVPLNKKGQPVLLNDPEKYSSPGGRCSLDISAPHLISSTNVLPDSLCSKSESIRSAGKTTVAATESFGSSEASVETSDTTACPHPHSTLDRPRLPGEVPESQTKSPITNNVVSVYSDESAGTVQLYLALFSPPNIPRIGLQRKATIRVAGSAVLKTRTAENRLAAYNKLSCASSTPSVVRSDGRRGEHTYRESTRHSHNGENEGYDALYNWDAQTSALARRVARRRMPLTATDTTNAQGNIPKAKNRVDPENRVLRDITNAFGGTPTATRATMHQVPRPLSRPRRHRPCIPAELLQIDASVSETSVCSSYLHENARFADHQTKK